MASITQKQLDEILRTVAALHSQLLAISEGAPVVPPHIQAIVDERLSKRICLACGQPIPEGDQVRRGVESSCYATQRSRIRRQLVTERELVETGQMAAEFKAPGRIAKQDLPKVDKAIVDAEEKLRDKRKKKSS